MQRRRAVALVGLVVLIVIIALIVHGCDVSATRNALQTYTNNVSSLIAQSNETSSRLFGELRGASAAGNPTQVQNQVNQTLATANKIVSQARNMTVPDQVHNGNAKLLWVLQMRADGIGQIASTIQPALGGGGQSAVDSVAKQMARFYASDVLYKDYAAPEIASAVNGAGVRFGGLNPGQFLPDVQWVLPQFVASQLRVSGGSGAVKLTPGKHGHALTSVTVNGTTMSTTTDNVVSTASAPTFTLHFTNDGGSNESNVVCKVTVTGPDITGQTTVPQTIAGQPTQCNVTLSSTPAPSIQTVVATIEKVPGEKDVTNNTISFPVKFG